MVKCTQDGHPRRFGFVTLDTAAALKCLYHKTQTINGCTVEVKAALPPWSKKLKSSWKEFNSDRGYSGWNSSWNSGWSSGQNSMGSDVGGSQWFNKDHP